MSCFFNLNYDCELMKTKQNIKASVFVEPGNVEEKEVEKPKINGGNQATIRVIGASVCDSDLWWLRGIADRESGLLIGHEAIGVVEEVSNDVTDIKPNDFVIVPFTHGCVYCVACIKGFEGNCLNQKSLEQMVDIKQNT